MKKHALTVSSADLPNAGWAPIMEAVHAHAEALVRVEIRVRRSQAAGRTAPGAAIEPGPHDDADTILAAVIDAAWEAEDAAGIPCRFTVTVFYLDGERRSAAGPFRVTLAPETTSAPADALESLARLQRQYEGSVGKLLKIITNQAEIQAANMERISGLLAPLVEVRRMELDHELAQAEARAKAEADERTWEFAEFALRAWLAKHGVPFDLGDQAEPDSQAGPEAQAEHEAKSDPEPQDNPEGGDALDGDIVDLDAWRAAALDMRRALDDERVASALRAARCISAWREASEATSERAFMRAVAPLAKLRSKPAHVARILSAAPYLRKHLDLLGR